MLLLRRALSFAVGEVEKPVVVLVNGDTVDESQETFFLDMSNVQNATVSSSRGTGSIVDDDGPTISINDVSGNEGNKNSTTNFTFTVRLSQPTTVSVNVNFTTANGTATAGVDYNSTSGTLVFGPGETSKTVVVVVRGDRTREADETFSLNLSSATGGTLADAQGVGTIRNDDR